jgi:hypothetical protein
VWHFRSIALISNINTFKSIYYAYFHSVIKYRIIFFLLTLQTVKIFTLQKKIVRIVAGVKPRTSCRSLFKQLEILPVPCQYILSLMKCIINNQENFKINLPIHNINTRNKHHFRTKCCSVLLQKKCILCWHKSFQQFTTILKNDKVKFRAVLRKYLNAHSFYTVDEIFYKDNL